MSDVFESAVRPTSSHDELLVVAWRELHGVGKDLDRFDGRVVFARWRSSGRDPVGKNVEIARTGLQSFPAAMRHFGRRLEEHEASSRIVDVDPTSTRLLRENGVVSVSVEP